MTNDLLKTLEVLSNCPAMYSQNVKKIKEHDDKYCIAQGHNICGRFDDCPMWEDRLKCWTHLYNRHLCKTTY